MSALNLFAAAVSLMTRLATEQPAGCVAEEVIAVSLVDEARAWLEREADSDDLSGPVAAEAIDALPRSVRAVRGRRHTAHVRHA